MNPGKAGGQEEKPAPPVRKNFSTLILSLAVGAAAHCAASTVFFSPSASSAERFGRTRVERADRDLRLTTVHRKNFRSEGARSTDTVVKNLQVKNQ
jgi:hypothetical protein